MEDRIECQIVNAWLILNVEFTYVMISESEIERVSLHVMAVNLHSFSATMSSADSISQDFSDLTLEDPLAQVTHDTLTDEKHKSLDEQIMKTFKHAKQLNLAPDLDSLLVNITVEDNRLKTLNSAEAAKLLADEPSIVRELLSAWGKSAFKEVRQLGALSALCNLLLSY